MREKRCEICLKLIRKTPEWRQWLWTYFIPIFDASIVDFKQVNNYWVVAYIKSEKNNENIEIRKYWESTFEMLETTG